MGGVAADPLVLPAGGGAVRGLGQTFNPDLHTGTGNYAIPLELPPGRAQMAPQLSLAYSSGNPTGVFGFGWRMPVPSVRRRTDKRLPRYDDNDDAFLLGEAEQLVAVRSPADSQRYRPRTDSLRARIEHHAGATEDYWEVWTPDGLRSLYGTPRPADTDDSWRDPATVAGPEQPERILAWLLTRTENTFGDALDYSYAPAANLTVRDAQRYLQQIGYVGADADHFIEIRFGYEPRPDVHVDRRGGFEVATTQRCCRIETWTGLAQDKALTRTVSLVYSDGTSRGQDNGVSLLTSVSVTGHDGQQAQTLPSLTFGYTTWDPSRRRVVPVAAEQVGRELPAPGLDMVEFADLNGNGLPDLLELSFQTARYWRNLGEGRFASPLPLPSVPAGAVLGTPGVRILDADGDSRPDVLTMTGDRGAGFFPLSDGSVSGPVRYRPYSNAPSFELSDPELRLLDLDGDGVTDALRTGTSLQPYLNRGPEGWQTGRPTAYPDGTALSFSDPRVRLADMTGDGLQDIVLLYRGRVVYWPNLGLGRFGSRVVMRNSPQLEAGSTGAFDPARVLLADLDGDGCADITYLGANSTTIWLNRSGQSFADPLVVHGTPRMQGGTTAQLVDVLGSGTAGILWSTRTTDRRPIYFLDPNAGAKPYLLSHVDNHMGTTSTVTYAPSTSYAVTALAEGEPWRTSCPAPIHVVASVVETDAHAHTRTTSTFRYHHGYWDGADREFRGFGRVDQLDAIVHLGPGPTDPHHSPPTLRRTWFHQGPVGSDRDWAELDLSAEYWVGDRSILGSGDRSRVPFQLSRRQHREAVRALRGRTLRSELYALDGLPQQTRPYAVTELAYSLEPVFEDGSRPDETWLRDPVFAYHQEASRTTQWERGDEPMSTIELSSGVDRYGNTRYTAKVAVPRGRNPVAEAADSQFTTTVTEIEYAVRDDNTHYICDRPSMQRVTAVLDDGGRPLAELRRVLFEPGALPVRALEFTRTRYDGPAYTGLPDGQLGEHGLPVAVHSLALTRGQLRDAWGPETLPPYLDDGAVWPATGLTGEYFRGVDFGDFAFTRPDPVIDFTWTGGPDPALARPDFSVRWEGILTPGHDEDVTFQADCVGALRLWVDDHLALDTDSGASTGVASVVGGTPSRLRAEFTARGWAARVRLVWSSASRSETVVGAPLVQAPPRPAPDWPAEYPQGFITGLAPTAGYVYRTGENGLYEPGYYIDTATRYDVDDDPTAAHGLATARRDPLGRVSTIEYDALGLFPVAAVDAVGMRREGRYDYRHLKLIELTDVNGNRTKLGYTPLGLTAWVAHTGREGTPSGDTPERPGTRYTYYLDEHDPADPARLTPLGVRTEKVVDHYWTIVARENERRSAAGLPPMAEADLRALFPADEAQVHPDRFVCSVAFNDGSGRTLQIRTQAEDVTLDDLGLDAQGSPAGPLLLSRQAHGQPARVVVSGRQSYDNKGRVVATWEPVFSTGWAYVPPDGDDSAPATETFYDARGQARLVRYRDGSEELAVHGVLGDVALPEQSAPSPWEVSRYDRNDNAERTHPGSASDTTHWNTPTTTVVDAWGRAVRKVERLADAELVTTHEYDASDRLVAVTDPAGRTVMNRSHDAHGRVWRTDLLDAGTERAVYDANGGSVEHRDSKGSLALVHYDELGRAERTWARDSAGKTVTLREVVTYGDNPASGLSREDAAARNLLQQHYRSRDEAGELTVESCDSEGRVMRSTRRLLSNHALLSQISDSSGDWTDAAFVVDWEADGRSPDDVAADVLDPELMEVDQSWNALGHRIELVNPADSAGARHVVRMEYSAAATPTTIFLDDEPVLRLAVHNARGQRIAEVIGNDVLTRYVYDDATSLLRRQHSQPATTVDAGWRPSGAPIVDQLRRYDLMGNPITVSERAPGSGVAPTPDQLDRGFTYDALYRLLTATGREHADPPSSVWTAEPRSGDVTKTRAYDEAYSYDAAGNLTLITHHADHAGNTREIIYDAGSNRATSLVAGGSVVAYRYDECGNQVGETDSRHFRWNAGNRLASFFVQAANSAPTVFAQYRYDATGDRVLKLVRKAGGVLERLVRVGALERLVVSSGSTEKVHDELHVGTAHTRVMVWRIGERQPGDQRPERCFDLADSLNSSVALLDEQGTPVSREEYSPFGETTFGGTALKRYRFTGRERDEESGLYHHGARYYAPWNGRWSSTDPTGLQDDLNLYAYAHGNPMKLSDPSGTATLEAKPQMELFESVKWEATANRTFIAHAKDHAKALKALCQQWGLNAKDYVLGHDKSTPHYKTSGSQKVLIGPQSAWANAVQSVSERAARALDKAKGLWGRVGRTDPGTAKGTRFPGSLDPDVARLAATDLKVAAASAKAWVNRHASVELLGKEGVAKLEAAGAQGLEGATAAAKTGLSKLRVAQGVASKALVAVGLYFTARDMHAAYQRGAAPFAAQTVREGAGWGGGFVGGFLLGAVVGAETGPGALVTGLVGGFLGTASGRAAAEQLVQGVKSLGPGFDAFVKPAINPAAPSPWHW